MNLLLNIIWFLVGGLILAIGWCIAGILCVITIVGIPLGIQCFKFAKLSLAPFGKEIKYGGGAPSVIANIIWLIFIGLPMAFEDIVVGCLFGLQCFKFAKLALMPFGAEITSKK